MRAAVIARPMPFLRRGRHADAEEKYWQVLPELDMHLGPQHPESLRARLTLADLVSSQSRRSSIIATFGFFNRRTLPLLFDRKRRGHKFEQAEALLQDGLLVCRNKLGNTHPRTIEFINELALCLQRQAPNDMELATQAKSLVTCAAEVLRVKLGADHPRTTEAVAFIERVEMLLTVNNVFTALKVRNRFFLTAFIGGAAIFFAAVILMFQGHVHDPLVGIEGRLPVCPAPDW